MANRPIPVSDANIMIENYMDYMQKHGVDMTKQTQAVGFNGKELQAWLSNVMPLSDELRIFFGVYPEGNANAGRITTILWPYKDGKPATQLTGGVQGGDLLQPYNEGMGHP